MSILCSSEASGLSVDQVLVRLETQHGQGLAEATADERRRLHGKNECEVDDDEPIWRKFIEQFKDPMILLLLASAAVSVFMGQYDDAMSIALAVVIVTTVAFVQEYRSDQSLEALKSLTPPKCQVLRSGSTVVIQAADLVVGDIVLLEVGDRVPADGRIIECSGLQIDESSLTGEMEPVTKVTNTISEAGHGVELAEMVNMAFMGSLVRNGRGSLVVTSVGTHTELGKVFELMEAAETPKSPLQQRMDGLGKRLSVVSIGLIVVIVLIGMAQGKALLDMFQIGVSLAVAAIPEGLPIVVTVTLALGVMRMARRNAVVKRLPKVEALGCVSVVCADKTGTLTRNEMTVVEAFTLSEAGHIRSTGDGYIPTDPHAASTRLRQGAGQVLVDDVTANASSHPHLVSLMEVATVCNNCSVANDGSALGQATEAAMLAFASKFDEATLPYKLRGRFERLEEIPFSSDTKWMGVRVRGDTMRSPRSPPPQDSADGWDVPGTAAPRNNEYFVKGSLEGILGMCSHAEAGAVTSSNRARPQRLTREHKHAIIAADVKMAAQGLRVLALARGTRLPDSTDEQKDQIADGLTFVGLVGLKDPARAGVLEAVLELRRSGVKVTMITGDSEGTAIAIAKQLQIIDDEMIGRQTVTSGDGAGTPASMMDAMELQEAGLAAADALALSGKRIDRMTDAELQNAIEGIRVFYRATPKHKMRIVKAFQFHGEIVAMTGDGVNDAPALKVADIGVAMGVAGTDVAKEAADVILMDDNFATILQAVEEGKNIFYNIRNFVRFQLSTSVAALALVAVATLSGMPNPLNAMQILWINIIMDGPPAQSLGVEPVDRDVMKQPPRKAESPIITRPLMVRVLTAALIIVSGTMLVFYKEGTDGVVTARDTTMTFTTFVMYDMFNALACRSANKTVFQIGFWSNRFFLFAVGGSLLGQVAVIYISPLQAIFQTEAIGLGDWLFIILLTAPVWWLDELRKWCRQRNSSSSVDFDDGDALPSFGLERVQQAIVGPQAYERLPADQDSPRDTASHASHASSNISLTPTDARSIASATSIRKRD